MRFVDLAKKYPLACVYFVGIVLLVVSSWLWWTKISVDPTRVFDGMLDQSLSTSGVTTKMTQKSGEMSVTQLVHYQTSPVNRAHSVSNLSESGNIIKTEMIGTPTADYMRYTQIKTVQKAADGSKMDFSKAMNVWAKSDDQQQSATQASGHQLYAQAVMGIGLPLGSVPVPIANLAIEQRRTLVDGIKADNIYTFAKDKVVKTRENGRLTYTYSVKVQTILYVRMMKAFAKDLGLKELDQVDPNDYTSAPTLEMKLTVDAHSKHLVKVTQANGAEQTYGGYDIPVTIAVPKKAITTVQLQQLFY